MNFLARVGIVLQFFVWSIEISLAGGYLSFHRNPYGSLRDLEIREYLRFRFFSEIRPFSRICSHFRDRDFRGDSSGDFSLIWDFRADMDWSGVLLLACQGQMNWHRGWEHLIRESVSRKSLLLSHIRHLSGGIVLALSREWYHYPREMSW